MGDSHFSDYVYAQLPPTYVRVTHADDTVPHVPPALFGLKHAGNEVWYPHDLYDGQFTECENGLGVPENGTCSNSLWIKAGISSHLNYLGYHVSRMCTRNQPKGTTL